MKDDSRLVDFSKRFDEKILRPVGYHIRFTDCNIVESVSNKTVLYFDSLESLLLGNNNRYSVFKVIEIYQTFSNDTYYKTFSNDTYHEFMARFAHSMPSFPESLYTSASVEELELKIAAAGIDV